MPRSLFLSTAFTLILSPWAYAAEVFSTEEYLKEVQSKNEEVKGALESSHGSMKRSDEGELSTSTTLYADGDYLSDAKLPVVPIYTYDKIVMQRYNLGIKKLTTFGLEAKAYYQVFHTNYVNVQSNAGTFPPINFFDARPTIELTQNIWGGGFGRATRANQQLASAQVLANAFSSRHRARAVLLQAEDAYWRLSLARERVEVTKTALEQAKKIYEWNSDRAKRNLADDVDALQSKAAFELRQLEMQNASDEERAASRLFNRFRNVQSDDVDVKLSQVDSDDVLKRLVPNMKPMRDDVRAAEQQQRAAIAGATVSIERMRPTFDIYGYYGLNGRNNALTNALGNPFQAGRPFYELGFRFNMPLNRGLASEAMAGMRQEQLGAEMIYRQKLNDQAREWDDLIQNIRAAKNRLRLSKTLAEVQKLKLKKERERLSMGRTTTFQVLMFEQDYAQSKLGEIAAKLDLVRTLNQVKLYGEPK